MSRSMSHRGVQDEAARVCDRSSSQSRAASRNESRPESGGRLAWVCCEVRTRNRPLILKNRLRGLAARARILKHGPSGHLCKLESLHHFSRGCTFDRLRDLCGKSTGPEAWPSGHLCKLESLHHFSRVCAFDRMQDLCSKSTGRRESGDRHKEEGERGRESGDRHKVWWQARRDPHEHRADAQAPQP